MPDETGRPRVVVGVAGGIAAYKSCELVRLLTESGHAVRVIPTVSALRFVGTATWAALSGQPVATDVWDDVHEVPPGSPGAAGITSFTSGEVGSRHPGFGSL